MIKEVPHEDEQNLKIEFYRNSTSIVFYNPIADTVFEFESKHIKFLIDSEESLGDLDLPIMDSNDGDIFVAFLSGDIVVFAIPNSDEEIFRLKLSDLITAFYYYDGWKDDSGEDKFEGYIILQ